jgi:hypothetical protein
MPAELYDRTRPRYPSALFDDLAELAGIGPGSGVLEIGPEPATSLGPMDQARRPVQLASRTR